MFKTHKCDYCEKKIYSQLEKETHIEKKHSAYACAQCSFKTHSLNLLDKHIKLHKSEVEVGNDDNKILRCIYCDEVFNNKIARRNHINKNHGNDEKKKKIQGN